MTKNAHEHLERIHRKKLLSIGIESHYRKLSVIIVKQNFT